MQFSEPLAPTSVTDTSVQLAGTGSIAIAKSLDLSDDGLLTITPVGSLALPQDLTLGLGGGITDPAGNGLDPLAYAWTLPNWLRLGDDPVMQYEGINASHVPLLVVDSAGTFVIAANREESPRARLRRWDRDEWQMLPLPAATGDNVYVHAVVIDDLDRLVMVWDDQLVLGAGWDFHVSRLDGAAWAELGDGLLVSPDARPEVAAVTVGNDGEPVVAWVEQTSQAGNPTDQYAARWNGASWVQLGSKIDAMDDNWIQTIDVTVSLNGAPLVSWVDRTHDVTEVRAFDATTSTWGSVGLSPFVDALPCLLTPSNGGLIAVGATTTGIRAYDFDGTTWVARGVPALRQAGASAEHPSVHLTPAGTVAAAWREYSTTTGATAVNVAELTEEGWEFLGEPIEITTDSFLLAPSLALQGGDVPAVATGTHEPLPGTSTFRVRTLLRVLNR